MCCILIPFLVFSTLLIIGLLIYPQGTKREACTILFMLLYYFEMAANLWWVVLTLTWFLAAGLKWGHEPIEAKSHYFHLVTWALPAALTIAILALGKVEGIHLMLCVLDANHLPSVRNYLQTPDILKSEVTSLIIVSNWHFRL